MGFKPLGSLLPSSFCRRTNCVGRNGGVSVVGRLYDADVACAGDLLRLSGSTAGSFQLSRYSELRRVLRLHGAGGALHPVRFGAHRRGSAARRMATAPVGRSPLLASLRRPQCGERSGGVPGKAQGGMERCWIQSQLRTPRFQACVDWCEGEISERRQFFPQLLSCVRLPLLPQGFLLEVVRPHALIQESVESLRLLIEAFSLHLREDPKAEAATPACRARKAQLGRIWALGGINARHEGTQVRGPSKLREAAK